MVDKHQVIIIGGGPAGLTSAIYLKRAGYEVLVIEREEIGGQIAISNKVANYPGVPDVDGETLSETMRKQAISFGASIVREEVKSVSLSDEKNVVTTDKGLYECRVLVYAAGSVPRRLNFRGEEEFAGRGVAYCATCDGELFTGKPIFVIGGGYAAAEEAVYLTRYGDPVTMIIREPDFTCAKEMADEAKNDPKVKIEYNTQIASVEGTDFVTRAVFHNDAENTDWEFESKGGIGIFVFAGYLPNTNLVSSQLVLDEYGYLITDEDGRTNLKSVYGAGDVCVKSLRQLVTAVSDGALAAQAIVKDHPLHTMEMITPPQNLSKGSDFSKKEEKAETKFQGFFQDASDKLEELSRHFYQEPVCKVYLDDSEASKELRQFMEELEKNLSKIHVEYIKAENPSDDVLYPFLAVSSPDGEKGGMYFHGIPGGHEFSTFLNALYIASGEDHALSEEEMNRLKKIHCPVRLDVGVTLSCNQCPVVAANAIKLAAYQPHLEAHVINVSTFGEFREKHSILSVPFMMCNKTKKAFGKRNAEELLQFIEEGIQEEVIHA